MGIAFCDATVRGPAGMAYADVASYFCGFGFLGHGRHTANGTHALYPMAI
jgi:hypothetical protein